MQKLQAIFELSQDPYKHSRRQPSHSTTKETDLENQIKRDRSTSLAYSPNTYSLYSNQKNQVMSHFGINYPTHLVQFELLENLAHREHENYVKCKANLKT